MSNSIPGIENSSSAPKVLEKNEDSKSPSENAESAKLLAKQRHSKQTSYIWDTSKVADGTYRLKIVASDRISNGSSARTDTKISEPFTICNSAPLLFIAKSDLKVNENKQLELNGFASSNLVWIRGVDYRIDKGEWMATDPKDGMFDSNIEEFYVVSDKLSPGEHEVELKAVDSALNATTEKMKFKVEKD